MLLSLSRKTRLFFYFCLFLALYITCRVLFAHKETFENPELPQLVIQKGNDHYLKRNVHLSSSVLQRKPYEWQTIKHVVGGSNEEFGKLNVHIWAEICGKKLQSLRNIVLFPQYPSRRFYTKTTAFSHGQGNYNYGERIFGYLHPKKTGLYSFKVYGISIEVWMSSDANPNHSKLVVKKASNNKHGSVDMEMTAGEKYYMEILHKKGIQDHQFELKWKSPGSSQYLEISGVDISRVYNDNHLWKGQVDSDELIERILAVHKKDPFPVDDNIEQARSNLHRLPLISDTVLKDVLPMCEYKPSYLVDFDVRNYRGVWETHYNSLYPIDRTNVTQDGWICLGNDVLQERKAVEVVEQFVDALNKAQIE